MADQLAVRANPLRLIKNSRAVMKLAPKRWPNNLPAPVLVAETRNKELAVSALRYFQMRDGQPVYACDLTKDQAADLARWAYRSPAAAP